ncbi:MAG TPA: hypothetical protein VK304_06695 [Thermoleophilaceae bacterium]|nr:hypothetical protein [Thermoleophilaceae bacterium]
MKTKTSLIITVLLATLGLAASPAQARDRTLVVPGKSIGGVKLGHSRAKVKRLEPLGHSRPWKRVRHGRQTWETYRAQPYGSQMIIGFSGRRSASKVRFISTGVGDWHTANGLDYGDSRVEGIGLVGGGDIYSKDGDGRRVDAEYGFDAAYLERRYSARRWFYLTFNTSGSDDVSQSLAGFALSSRRIP